MVLAVGGLDVFDATAGVIIPFAANMSASANDTDDFAAAGAASIISTAGTIFPSVWSAWTSGNYVTATMALKPASVATSVNRVSLLTTLSVG
jgi:hypothetical protein